MSMIPIRSHGKSCLHVRHTTNSASAPFTSEGSFTGACSNSNCAIPSWVSWARSICSGLSPSFAPAIPRQPPFHIRFRFRISCCEVLNHQSKDGGLVLRPPPENDNEDELENKAG